MVREVGVLHLWLHNKKRLSKSHKSDFKGYQDALSRKERIFSEKPYLYVSVCPNIPTRDITKNAFLWQGVENANNPQYAILDWWTELFTNYARTSCAISDKYISIKRIYARASCANSKIDKTISAMLQTSIDDIEKDFVCSPISKINWTSHVILLDSSLPLGNKYWYMKQSVENGWSSNVLKIQIETNLFKRQIETQKVNNFTKTLPAPQSDLANYLLKDPYIFDVAGTKELADERDIENSL